MPQFMLISISSLEGAPDMELSPEMIQAIIQKYNDWTESLERAGKLVGLNKLADDLGRRVRGTGEHRVVTDGPYAETKEVIGGYWIVEATDYDEAVELASGCPTLEWGGTMEVRQVEDLSALGG